MVLLVDPRRHLLGVDADQPSWVEGLKSHSQPTTGWMVLKPYVKSWEKLEEQPKTTFTSTGELIPDFWLPSTVWGFHLKFQQEIQ